jgi:teichoic acid transport system ATP-binding protein
MVSSGVRTSGLTGEAIGIIGANGSGKSTLLRTIAGLAMGLSQEEVRSKMDELVDFAGLGDAMGRPMRTYSSGMRARLTFSIATLKTPEILLIDEALAVGDRSFRAKSLAKVREIQHDANSVVMVTHNLTEIRETCSRVLWLDQSRLVADGEVDAVLDSYEASDDKV